MNRQQMVERAIRHGWNVIVRDVWATLMERVGCNGRTYTFNVWSGDCGPDYCYRGDPK